MPKSGADHTDAMRAYAVRRLNELAKENLSGYILKKDSPSCGMERVRVYDVHGVPAKSGQGLFAEALLQQFPTLPVEEEGRLSDPHLREVSVRGTHVFPAHFTANNFPPRVTVLRIDLPE
jgi:uncharacterized protein YbbK (DUF523 family)